MKTSIYDLLVNRRKIGRVYLTLLTPTRAAADILLANGSNVRFDDLPSNVIGELHEYLKRFAAGRPFSLREAAAEQVRQFEKPIQECCFGSGA
jgi:hypothetical protein